MKESLTRIKVENFKNLKNFDMPLRQLNVLIGPNGAGKTNVLELVKFVHTCTSMQDPYFFDDFGGYKNMVWSDNDSDAISMQVTYTIDNHDITYDSTITSDNGRLKILEEKFQIRDYLEMSVDTDRILYRFEPPFAKKAHSSNVWPSIRAWSDPVLDLNAGFAIFRRNAGRSILKAGKRLERIFTRQRIAMLQIITPDEEAFWLPSPVIKGSMLRSLYGLAADYMAASENVILLGRPDYNALRLPVPVRYTSELGRNGAGLANLLFQWQNKDRKLPETITLALDALYPNWNITPRITEEHNIVLDVTDGTMRLAPSSVPDGFYRLLTILAAIELKPKILLVDGIEDSLHARSLEYILGLLKFSEMTVLITTHSPLVVDYVDIRNLILLECADHKSTCRNVKDPDALQKELTAKGITVSECWLYADL